MISLEESLKNAFELNINVGIFNNTKYIKENLKDVPFNKLNYSYYYESTESKQYKKLGKLTIDKSKLSSFNFDSFNDRKLLKLFEVKREMDSKVLFKNDITN